MGGRADERVEPGQGRGVADDLEARRPGPGGAGVVVEPHAPRGLGGLLCLRLGSSVELDPRLGDQPVDARHAARVRDPDESLVDVRRRLDGQVPSPLGDPPGAPRRHLQRLDRRVGAREPVLEVQPVGHQPHHGPRRRRQRGRQLLHARRTDQRRPDAADGLVDITRVDIGPVRRVRDLRNGVPLGPHRREPEPPPLGDPHLGLGLPSEREHEVVVDRVHHDRHPCVLHLDHHRDHHARRDHRQSASRRRSGLWRTDSWTSGPVPTCHCGGVTD